MEPVTTTSADQPKVEHALHPAIAFSKYSSMVLIFILLITCGLVVWYERTHKTEMAPSASQAIDGDLPAKESGSNSNAPEDLQHVDSIFPKLYNTERYQGNDKNAHFYTLEGMVHLIDTSNVSLRTPLRFPEADPLTFKHVEWFVGFDKSALHFAEYAGDTYVASTTKLSPEELSLLELYAQNSQLGVIWLRQPTELSGELQIKSYSQVLQDELNKNFVEVSDAQGPLLYMFADTIHAKTLRKRSHGLLLFDTKGLYEIKFGAQPELILDKESKYLYQVYGSDNVFYLNSYSAPNIFQFHIPSRTVRRVGINDERRFVRSTNIFVTADESRVYTRASWNEGDAEGYLPDHSALLEIDIATGEIVAEIPYEIRRHGSLYPFVVSPNKKYVYNIPIPYEGYMFDEMEYYEINADGSWSASSTVFKGFRLEVYGGWNAHTGQWIVSPDQSRLAISDAKELHTANCEGMGDMPSIQNQLKILNLDALQATVIKELGSWEEFEISHWSEDGAGLYYKVADYEPGTCNKRGVSELRYIKI